MITSDSTTSSSATNAEHVEAGTAQAPHVRRPAAARRRALACVAVLGLAATCAFAATSVPDGGGSLQNSPHDELSPAFRARIDTELARNVAELVQAGRLSATPPWLTPQQGGLAWPLRPANGYADYGYHGISNFVDLNAGAGQTLDWNCGARTYDGHAGIDIFLTPFPWLMMDQGSVDIVAAAPGTIIGKIDGNDDRSCPNHFSADWNAVYVQHADGSVAWYGHMKKFSQTGQPVGATVAAGDYLGKVGSAGFSTGPHLHFELHSSFAGYAIQEPFSGACNAAASLWAEQRPYYDSAIVKLATHAAPPDYHGDNCPDPVDETPNLSDQFYPGDAPIFAAYYRDQLAGQVTTFRVLRPDGSVFDTWSGSSDAAHYAASYWYWTRSPLPAAAPEGLWRFVAEYEGQTYEHAFAVGDVDVDMIFADGFD